MSQENFSIDWPHGHVTRDGRKARIICTDRKYDRPILALIARPNGEEDTFAFESDGRYVPIETSGRDLINAPVPRESKWINVYPSQLNVGVHSFREDADRSATGNRTGVVEVVFVDGKPVDVKLHK